VVSLWDMQERVFMWSIHIVKEYLRNVSAKFNSYPYESRGSGWSCVILIKCV